MKGRKMNSENGVIGYRAPRDPSGRAIYGYLNRLVERTDTLSEEILFDLLAKARAGDIEARNKVVVSNLRLVRYIMGHTYVRRYLASRRDDCFQDGVIGLMIAVDTWEPDRGAKFSTFASWIILQRIWDRIRRSGRENRYRRLARLISRQIEVDDSVNQLIEEEWQEHIITQSLMILWAIGGRERDVLLSHNGIGPRKETHIEIARRYGITKQRAQQLEMQAARKIREALEGEPLNFKEKVNLKDYVETVVELRSRGLTQLKIARTLGISHNSVWKILNQWKRPEATAS